MKWWTFPTLTMLAACNLIPPDTTADSERAQEAAREQNRQEQARRSAQDASAESEMNAMLLHKQTEMRREQAAIDERNKQYEVESHQKHELATWKNGWRSECAAAFSYTTCTAAPALATQADKDRCLAECKEAIVSMLEQRFKETGQACASGDGEVRCDFHLPASAANSAGQPIPDSNVAAANVECTKQCVAARAEIALDVQERPKATAAGESLILAYKRCMLAVDSTHQALTYRIHDTDLYQDLMAKADARCRAASRCDWVEKHSDWACSYGRTG